MAYPILAPNSTWYKSSTARNTITQINIVNSYTPTGSENESWNADVGNTGSIKCYRTGTVITMAGNGSGKIAANADSARLFSYGISSVSETNYLFLQLTDINGLELIDTSNATTLQGAFAYCLLLTDLDLSSWDVSNVTNLRMTFGANAQVGEMGLTSINVSSWDTSKVTTMRAMCQCCSALTTLDVSKWDTSSNTDMSYAFYKCSALTILDVSNWDTSEVTTMQQTFARCTSLTALDVSNWDVSKVTTMRSMFSTSDYGLTIPPYTELDVSKWDTSSCTDMGWMFYGCRNLNHLNVSNWDVSNVECLHHFIAHSFIYLEGVENWDVSNCRAFNATFYCCTNATLDLSNWDVSKGVTFSQMFEGAPNLVEIKGLERWNTSSGRDFDEMFKDCASLKKLDLSSFDTRNASTSYTDEWNSQTGGMSNMFKNVNRLEQITFGENFSFDGDGTCPPAVLPTPDATYISGADGNWYDEDGNPYAVTAIPVGAGTYYAFKALALGNISKVEYFDRVLVDLTEDSVTPETVFEGETFHGADGESKTGTFTLETEMSEQDSLIAQIQQALQGKAAGGGGSGGGIDGFPDGYTLCDYIQFTNRQFVDTGIIGNQDTRIQATFTWENSTQRHLYGCTSSDNTASVTSYMNGAWRFGNKSSSKTIGVKHSMVPYTSCVDKSTISVTGSVYSISGVNDFETVGTLLLGGARSSDGSLPTASITGKVYRFRIWQNDVEVLNLWPVVSAEGVYRFFDSVSKTFFDSISSEALGGGNV